MQQFAGGDAAMFSTPGHKRGRGIDDDAVTLFGTALAVDVPHGGGIDTTHFNLGILREAEHLAAQAHGADDARFLVNGSTAGNLAMILATCRDGDTILISRMLHKSLLAALIFSGARPVYLTPAFDPGRNLPLETTPDEVAAALRDHPDARAVMLVSPSYVGVSSDLSAISDVCHRAGVPLLVDEAWGPHFHFHPQLPDSAMASGADAAVSSTHKMLAALTQGSTLTLRRGLLDLERLHTIVDMVQTTSPSVLIYGSLDASRRQMALHGEALLARTLELAGTLRCELAGIDGLDVLGPEIVQGRPGVGFDPARVMVDVHGLGLTGHEAEEILRREHGVHVEMSDLLSVLLLITIGDDETSIARALAGFRGLRDHATSVRERTLQRSSGALLFDGEIVMTPREAFNAESESVKPEQARGRISAETITPYPPGIPLITPGERIDRDSIDYLRAGREAGMHISGLADPSFGTIRVVVEGGGA